MSADSLFEIPRSQWSKLKELYADRPTLACGYNLLQNYMEWIEKDPQLPVHIFTPDKNWEICGTFILKHEIMIYCNTLSKDINSLTRALNCLERGVRYFFFGLPDHVKPALRQHFLDSGLSAEQFDPEGAYWYHIRKDDVEKFTTEPPKGYSLSQLQLCHAEEVNRIWPHNAPGTIKYIEQLIRLNDSVGVFDEQGNLIAWCLILPLGILGVLQVIETHKRKGLGSLVVRYMSKKLAAKGLETCASVIFENYASRSMFEKLGFQIVDKAWWTFKPMPIEQS